MREPTDGERGTSGPDGAEVTDSSAGGENPETERLLTTAEAGEILGVGSRQVRNYVHRGWLAAVRGTGRNLLIREGDLRTFAEGYEYAHGRPVSGADGSEGSPAVRGRRGDRQREALAELTQALRTLTDRQESLEQSLTEARDRAARAEGALVAVKQERDRLVNELERARAPFWRRWFG